MASHESTGCRIRASRRYGMALTCLAGAAFAGGCTGVIGDAGPPVEPKATYACVGNVSDPAGDSTPLPGGPGPAGNVAPLDICDATNVAPAAATAHCLSKCQSSLSQYATLINASLPVGTPPVQLAQLTCNVSNFVKIESDCPNTDPPGEPEPLFAGGPAQYVANLSGSVIVAADTQTPLGTVSTEPGTTGQIAYTILPPDRVCPPAGCQLLVTSFGLHVDDFSLGASFLGVTLFDEHVANMRIQNVGWINGTWQPNGHFSIPGGTASVVVTAVINGSHGSFDRPNDNPITGTIDPVAGTVTFDSFSQQDTDTTLTVQQLAGSNFRSPPVAAIAMPDQIECGQVGGSAVTLDGAGSQGTDLHFFTWSVNGGAPLSGVQVPATLALGSNVIGLTVMNAAFGIGIASKHVQVVDTTPPSFASLPPVTDEVCAPGSQIATISTPRATDVCSSAVGVTVTGAVVSSNGVPLPVPIPIINGGALLPPGVHTVQWTAVDASGNPSKATQILTVRPAIEASRSIVLEEKARVVLPGAAGFAMMGNSGSGRVNIGRAAQTGSVLSEGPIDLEERSIVNGDLRSAKAIHLDRGARVTGSVLALTAVPMPAGRDLVGVVFPTTNAGRVDVRRRQTRKLSPGAYSDVTVANDGVLVLSAGTYFFSELDLADDSRLNLDQSAGAVSVFVRRSMVYDGRIASIAGNPGGFLLGYAGSEELKIRSRFLGGTIVAPNASVEISARESEAFRGQLFAQTIEIKASAIVTCDPIGLSAK